MKMKLRWVFVLPLALLVAVPGPKARAQTAPSASRQQSPQAKSAGSLSAPPAAETVARETDKPSLSSAAPDLSSVPQPLFDSRDTDVKFKLESLMTLLRDSRHEGWVLAAYPDPKTSRPLIGAGFGLDVVATQHPQSDPLNPNPFLEPSSAQLWQAAGLDAEKLQSILNQFDRRLNAWNKKNFRRKIRTHKLPPDITEEEATSLLRVSAIQAIHNARAYCRQFDQLTAPQQMALSQLVYQMGVNLEQFVQFLRAINDDSGYYLSVGLGGGMEGESQHWKDVQCTLIHSDWAKRYSSRAIAVIAMFNPNYDRDPVEAERQVRAQIHPLVHHRKSRTKTVRAASNRSRQVGS